MKLLPIIFCAAGFVLGGSEPIPAQSFLPPPAVIWSEEEKSCEHCGGPLTDQGRCPYCQPKPSFQAGPSGSGGFAGSPTCRTRIGTDLHGRPIWITQCGPRR